MKKTRTTGNEGFTIIEVLISLIVFMVALLGLVSLQGASIEGADRGRQQTAAMNIARYITAQVQDEVSGFSLLETTPDPARQPLLSHALGTPATWVLLPGAGSTDRFDAYLEHSGMPTYTVDSAPYCAAYWVDTFDDPGAGAGVELQGLYKVRVRVSWPRKGQYGAGTTWKDCSQRLLDTKNAMGPWESIELRTIMSREFVSRWKSAA